jgi:spore coat polysaccharide biosynthesis protein SpsF (cytidylyltransferase family)
MLEHVMRRAARAQVVDRIYVLTTGNPIDDEVEREAIKILNDIGQKPAKEYVIRGYDVPAELWEFISALKHIKDHFFVRLTADNPMIDPEIIDDAVKVLDSPFVVDIISTHHDIFHNGKDAYPPGYDVEVVSRSALLYPLDSLFGIFIPCVTWTLYADSKCNRVIKMRRPVGMHNVSLTVDTQKDFDRVKKVMEECGVDAGWREIAAKYNKKKGQRAKDKV